MEGLSINHTTSGREDRRSATPLGHSDRLPCGQGYEEAGDGNENVDRPMLPRRPGNQGVCEGGRQELGTGAVTPSHVLPRAPRNVAKPKVRAGYVGGVECRLRAEHWREKLRKYFMFDRRISLCVRNKDMYIYIYMYPYASEAVSH